MPTKSRGPSTHTGGTGWSGASFNGPTSYFGKQFTSSAVSPGPPYVAQNAFNTEKLVGRPGRVSLTKYWSDGKQVRARYSDYACVQGIGQNSSPAISHWPFGYPSFQESWVTTALARVNFTKPIISLPNFIFELREFPSMLRDLGRVLSGGSRLSDIPGAHLAWQFGWDPLISDIRTLFDLSTELEKLRKRFLKAKMAKRLQGSIGEDEYSKLESVSNGVVGVASHRRRWTGKDEIWYTAHWECIAANPPELFGDKWSVWSNALGLNRPAAVIWAAIPWSFVIDYFTNVSTFLEASGGFAEYRPTKVCIMHTHEAECVEDTVVFDSTLISGTSYTPLSYKITNKARTVRSHPVPRPMWDTFGFENKLGILTSLATANGLRGARS